MELRFRQVHLDFHTSQHITGIGAAFDPDEFADTLARAHVNSVTCFARCHHGYIYYETQKFPERRHPHLQRNLLPEMIAACHARGIRMPIYTTIQWDQFTADQHPEWLALGADGKVLGTPPYEAGFYRFLMVNSPYFDFLKEHVREIFELMPVDGFFFDITQSLDDSSIWTRNAMLAAGLNPSDPEARFRYGLQVIDTFKLEMTAFVRQFSPDCTIFYNAGHVSPFEKAGLSAYSHLELESLPSGGWGYLHFPLTARYARALGKDILGMTGKFHTSWGDFHSFKNPAALQFECFQMLALGAKCSIGDQLQPYGKICPATYDLIGSVYAQVEKKEPWCAGAAPLTDIGLLNTEEWNREQVSNAAAGAVMMLQEAGSQFNVLDTRSDFTPYKVLILPDTITLNPELAKKIEAYLAQGGSLIASYHSGLDTAGQDFALPSLGLQRTGEAPFSPDFILPAGEIGRGLPETEHVMYQRGLQVAPQPGTQVLAQTAVPYFNRTWEHFCSHRHTPSSHTTGYRAILRRGRAVYFAHPIFNQYRASAPRWVKTLFLNALDLLLPQPLVRKGGPSTLLVTLHEQPQHQRRVLHLLHYIPERRGLGFDTIEDVIPLYNIPISLRADSPVQSVTLVPDGPSLPFTQSSGRVEFTVPAIHGHQMVEIQQK